MANPSMHWADWLIVAVTLLLSVVIGLYQGRRSGASQSQKDYFFGGQSMSLVPVAFSITASFLSAILIVGVPAEIYLYGVAMVFWAFSFVIANFISAFAIAPVLYDLEMTSAYEYLELRFKSRAVRLLAACLSVLWMIVLSGIVAYAPSTALAAVSPIPSWASVIAIVFITAVYSSLGGIRGVVWTDAWQVLVMLAGILAILIKGCIVEGASQIFTNNKDGGRLDFDRFFDFDPRHRYTFWSMFIGGVVANTGYMGYSQPFYQRIKSVSCLKKAQWSLLISGVGFGVLIILSAMNGFVIYSHFVTEGCDPLSAGYIKNPNQYVSFYVLSNFQMLHGFLGLLLASLFCATLSTLSSNINSVTAIIWEDILKPHFNTKLSEGGINILLRSLGFLLGAVMVAIGIVADRLKGSLLEVVVSLSTAGHGPILGVYILGALCPWMNAAGAFSGTLCGFAVAAWIAVGSILLPNDDSKHLPLGATDTCPFSTSRFSINETSTSSHYLTTVSPLITTSEPVSGLDDLYSISYYYFALVGMIVQFLTANIVCFIAGYTDPHSVDRKYLLFSPKCLCFLKSRTRNNTNKLQQMATKEGMTNKGADFDRESMEDDTMRSKPHQ